MEIERIRHLGYNRAKIYIYYINKYHDTIFSPFWVKSWVGKDFLKWGDQLHSDNIILVRTDRLQCELKIIISHIL